MAAAAEPEFDNNSKACDNCGITNVKVNRCSACKNAWYVRVASIIHT